MDPDFKEKEEERGIKEEGTTEDATIRLDFRASTPAIPAASQSEQGTEGRAKEIQPQAGEVRREGQLRGMGQSIRRVCHIGAAERRGESLTPLPFLDWWSTDVFCRAAGAGEHDVPSQGRGPSAPVRTGN